MKKSLALVRRSALAVALFSAGVLSFPTAHANAAETITARSEPAMAVLAPVAVKAFYAARDGQAAWASEADFNALLTALEQLANHGLNPEHYRLAELRAARANPVARERIATDAWFSAAAHMVDGKVDPVSVEPNWTAARRSVDLQSTLTAALVDGRIAQSLDALAPRQPAYARLVTALRERREQLEQQHDLQGLPQLQNEVDQLRVNMERWRWLPDDLGQRHIRANIADFRLEAWQDGEVARTHRIIVGKLYRKTPVFSSSISYLVLNPWWETPARLARVDKLKVFKKDPGAVKRLGFKVLDREGQPVNPDSIDWSGLSNDNFPYRIRQAPGEMNALGKVKIMFPNRHNVYLHDTPSRDLFEETTRTFSSGCLRTEHPLELAKWLLEGSSEWQGDAVDRAVETGRVRNVNLDRPVPVHVLYFTAVSDDAGGVRLIDDVYERDGRVLESLKATPGRTRQRAATAL